MVLLRSPSMTPLCTIETPFQEKFGTPRQPLLIPEAEGILRFPKNDFYLEAFRGIENFSHLWLVFSFHQAVDEGFKALVRPPRFLGKEKWGVFASRSPHRPNHIGMSVVKFLSLEVKANEVVLKVSGVDLVSGTPILDIKPYIAYTDSIVNAVSGKFQEKPEFKKVRWECEVVGDKVLIEKVVGLDPRPGFDQEDEFGVSVGGVNVRFQFRENEFVIISALKIS